MNRLRWAALSIVGVPALAWAATGCAAPEPTVMQTPTIIWAEGVKPTSPLEDEPMVVAAREAWIGLSMAQNTGDFTIAQLTNHLTDEYVASRARTYSGQSYSTSRDPGPWPWQPLRIVEDTPEYGIIEVCMLDFDVYQLKTSAAAGYKPWFITPQEPIGGGYDRSRTDRATIRMEKTDGKYLLNEWFDDKVNDEPCDGSTIPVGLFDPQPDPPPEIITEPVRAPLIKDWEDLGW